MSEQNIINNNSSKEEVADFFVKEFNIKEEIKKNILKEDISGDVLHYLDKDDLKKLGFGLGTSKKILIFLKDNKDKFKEKKINIKITIKSTSKEVSDFFKNCLNFTGDLNKLNGKGLIEINDEQIKKLGLNIGQRKKIIK